MGDRADPPDPAAEIPMMQTPSNETSCSALHSRCAECTRDRRRSKQARAGRGRHGKADLSAGQAVRAARLLQGRRHRRRDDQLARRCRRGERVDRRRGAGRRRLLRPHDRHPEQGQVDRFDRAAEPRPGRGRTGVDEAGGRHQGAGRLQGQDAGHHRRRLLHRLPDPCPDEPRRPEAGRLFDHRRRRRQYLHRGNEAGPDRCRHDHRTHDQPDALDRGRQGVDRHALRRVDHGRARRHLSGRLPVRLVAVARAERRRGSEAGQCNGAPPCGGWPATAPPKSPTRCRRNTWSATGTST